MLLTPSAQIFVIAQKNWTAQFFFFGGGGLQPPRSYAHENYQPVEASLFKIVECVMLKINF